MPIQKTYLRRFAPHVIALGATGVGIWAYTAEWPLSAEEGNASTAASQAGSSNEGTKSKKHRGTHRGSFKPVNAPKTPALQDDVTGSTPHAPDSKASAPIDFAAQLNQAGASGCSSQINALATSTMGSVEKFNTVSNWSQESGDKRAVSLAIGQRFAAGSAVPFGVSQVISTPNQRGSCDGFTVQVFPSPLSCSKLKDSITKHQGKQIGDLAGIPLMQDATGRAMLVPTAADTCVLVATKTFYAK